MRATEIVLPWINSSTINSTTTKTLLYNEFQYSVDLKTNFLATVSREFPLDEIKAFGFDF